MTTISIALATFNGERFLAEQIRSLLSQSKPPDEIVIADDGSQDGTLAILERFAAEAVVPIHIHRNNTRLGWRANFLKAAGLCRGSLIFFCDQDDVWYSDKLRLVEALFDDPEVLLVHHDADLIDERGCPRGTLRDGERDKEQTERLHKPTIWSHAPGLTIALRRSLLAFGPYWPASVDLKSPEMPAAHDQWMYHLASNLGRIRFMPESLVGYRQHGANQIGFRPERHHALSSPDSLKNEISIHAAMISGFREALQQALHEGKTGFESQLPEAIEANMLLEKRLKLRRALYNGSSIGQRLTCLVELVRSGSYRRATHWSLGRRSLLADTRAVLRRPR